MNEPLFFDPVFHEKIWGGSKIKNYFPSEEASDGPIGEAWIISAHPHGVTRVMNGPYTGIGLDELWETHKELFGDLKSDRFPLLIKIINAEDDLAVQVHPNDKYALKNENDLGKEECWYVLKADPKTKFLLGTKSKTKEAFQNFYSTKQMNDFFNKFEVSKGDFYFIPTGMVHAIGKGSLVLEIQQSSDITYRVYNYDKPQTGKLGLSLDIDKALDVINFDLEPVQPINYEKQSPKSNCIRQLVDTSHFSVSRLEVKGSIEFKHNTFFKTINVLEGSGKMIARDAKSFDLLGGMSCIIPHTIQDWKFTGELTVVISEPKA